MNCLQVMVERSSTTAWAGTDGSTRAAPARFQGNVVKKTESALQPNGYPIQPFVILLR
jgi:hypothetical protein